MQYRMNSVLVVALAVLVMLLGTTAQAGTISITNFTDDAGSGISSDKVYTHALDFGRSGVNVATVNGVPFSDINHDRDEDGDALTLNYVSDYEFIAVQSAGDKFTSWFYIVGGSSFGVASSEGVYDLMFDCQCVNPVPAGSFYIATLSGLTPGQQYDYRVYYRPWEAGGDRSIDLTFDVGGANDTTTINEDAGDGNFSSYVSYTYTASAAALVVKFVTPNNNNVWHLYGMTNEEVVPEPSTLALLTTGLIGLLCYAWKKRKQ